MGFAFAVERPSLGRRPGAVTVCGQLYDLRVEPQFIHLIKAGGLDLVEMGCDLATGGLHILHVTTGLLDVTRERRHAFIEALKILRELASASLMTWICLRVSTSFITARAVLSTAIKVVGDTIHTRLRCA